MRKLFGQRNELRIVDDQIGAPTWSRQLAEATAQVLAQTAADGFHFGDRAGLYHLTSAGRTSWYGFASVIRDLLNQPCKLLPIPSSEYPTPAKRPGFSVLDNGKIEENFRVRLPDWQEALVLCIEELRLMA
jgi:dTDP-4-dehydrorhamnose reductase